MKEKIITLITMLVGGFIACICCIIGKFSLLHTLEIVLLSLVVFMIIGIILDKIVTNINNEVKKAEEEKIEAEKIEAKKKADELAAAKELDETDGSVESNELEENNEN